VKVKTLGWTGTIFVLSGTEVYEFKYLENKFYKKKKGKDT
jgi:hypothetical protein